MGKDILVVSYDVRETRVALIEDGIIAELHIERRGNAPKGGAAGDVYLGKVTRVLPGLQAAFVDIGLERAAFLHVEDLIRPQDFEGYLAGGRRHARDEQGTADGEGEEAEGRNQDEGSGEALAAPPGAQEAAPPSEILIPDDPSTGILPTLADDAGDGLDETLEANDDFGRADEEIPFDGEEEPDLSEGEEDDAAASEEDEEARAEEEASDEPQGEDDAGDEAGDETRDDVEDAGPTLDDDFLDNPNLPGFTISDPNETSPRAAEPRERRGGRRGPRRGRGRDRRGGEGQARGRNGSRGGSRERSAPRQHAQLPGRLSKSTPIREVVKEGQEIIVQITKEPIGTKGARCSSHISFPGRYVVYLPTVDHIGISKRIGSDAERARLRETIMGMKPPTGGLIVRTLGEGLTKKQLKQDVGYLVRLWGEIAKKREGLSAPALLSSELDIVLRIARDLFNDSVEKVVIDDRKQYERLRNFVEMFMPDRVKDIELYEEDEPIFDAYGIEEEIARALSRKVPLPSGGYLIIDQAEALTAIDVNTGRFVGKNSKDMEETILQTNLEAVSEIAYQLRFRNIGGLIILDLIDMERAQNREKVRRKLEDVLQKDKAKTTLNRISELGLIEMTRKRTRESLGRLMHEPCFYCDGTGQLQSKETIAYEILREIRRKKQDLPGYTVHIACHPAVADLLTGSEKAAVTETENRFMRKIHVTPRKEYHLEQFDISGR